MVKYHTRRACRRRHKGGSSPSDVYVYYHIYSNKYTLPVLKDQVTKIVFSGLYTACKEVRCYLTGDEQFMGSIETFLKDSGVKFVIGHGADRGVNDTSFERFTLNRIAKNVKENDKLLYIHTKGASEKHQGHENIYWWRTWMEYHLIHRFKECLEALDKVNLVGVGYTDMKIGPHFSGNFWWTKGSYFNTLPKNADGTLAIGSDYWMPESFIFKGQNPTHLDLDPSIDPKKRCLYNSKPGIRASNNGAKKGGRRRTR